MSSLTQNEKSYCADKTGICQLIALTVMGNKVKITVARGDKYITGCEK